MPGKLKVNVQIFTKDSKQIRMVDRISLAVVARECEVKLQTGVKKARAECRERRAVTENS